MIQPYYFNELHFTDAIMQKCHIYLGAVGNLHVGPLYPTPNVVLTPEHAAALWPILKHFAETGELTYPTEDEHEN